MYLETYCPKPYKTLLNYYPELFRLQWRKPCDARALLYPPEASGGYFGLVFAMPPPRVDIFGVNALRGKQQQLGSPNLQDIFVGG